MTLDVRPPRFFNLDLIIHFDYVHAKNPKKRCNLTSISGLREFGRMMGHQTTIERTQRIYLSQKASILWDRSRSRPNHSLLLRLDGGGVTAEGLMQTVDLNQY